MPDRTLDLYIKVTENGSTVFKKLGADAKAMGRDADLGAKQAQRGFEGMKKSATEVGVALGTAVTALSLVGRASNEQARQIDGIKRAYGEAADEVLSFAENIQESTTFSNDSARQAALSAVSLRENYGLTAAQIQEVIRVSADLATVMGVDLADATARVAGSIRGEGEAAELLSLNMSDAAVSAAAAAAGITNWSTGLSEAEKAAFRYSLVIEQASFAQGAAADAADSNAGRAKQFANELGDIAQQAGSAAGPLASYTAILGDVALAAPLAGAGIGKLAGAAKVAGAPIISLAASLGPVGLIAAGVGAVAVLGQMTDWMGIFGDSVPEAERQVQNLTDSVYALNAAGAEEDLILAAQSISDRWEAVGDALNDVTAQTEAQAQASYDLNQAIRNGGTEEEIAALQARLDSLSAAYDTDVFSNITNNITELTNRLDDADVNTDKLLTDINAQIQAFEAGEITLDQMNASVGAMLSNFNEWYVVLPQATAATNDLTGALQDLVGINLADFDLDIFLRNIGAAQREAAADQGLAETIFGWGAAAGEAGRELNDATRASVIALNEQGNALAAVKAEAAAYAAEIANATDGVVAFIGEAENILPVLLAAGKGLTGEQGLIRGVLALTNAQSALDSTFGIIVGGTDAIGQSAQQVADWAQGLIDAGGAGADLNALNGILADNAAIQEDVTAIQAAQSGFIADATSNYAQYVDQLANGTAEQQRYALALADANSQQQLADLYAAATAASLGQLGENGTDYVNQMAASLAVTNPLLYEMLVGTGAIKETADGIVFAFDAEDAQSMVGVLGDLNATLEVLVQLLAEAAGIDLGGGLDKATGAAERLTAALADTDSVMERINRWGGIAPPPVPQAATRATGDGTGGTGGANVQAPSLTGSTGVSPVGGPVLVRAPSVTPVTVPLILDTTQATEAAGKAGAVLRDLAGGQYQVEITANGESASAAITTTEGELVALVQGDYIIPINADGTFAYDEGTKVEGALEALVGGSYVATINGNGQPAQAEIDLVNRTLNALNGTTGVIYIQGDGSGARSVINALTGYQGEAYINVRYNQAGGIGFTPLATGGTVTSDMGPRLPRYAGGGTHAWVGEHGPEAVWLPHGSQVTNAVASRSRFGDPGGGGITVNLTIAGNVYGMADLTEQVADVLAPALEQAFLDHRAANGAGVAA